MKARWFLSISLVAILVLVMAGAASQKPATADEPLGSGYLFEGGADAERPPAQQVSPAVTLGQPGLSYRYERTFGVAETPYPSDTVHLNDPTGLFIDSSDNLYVAEEAGQRVLKFGAMTDTLVIGYVGLPFHGSGYLSWPKDVAVDANGHIWVVSSNAVNEFGADGAVVQWFPSADPWNAGNDSEHFDDPTGIAFDSAGRLYISDHWNHRIQVYTFAVDGSLVYSATIGVTRESGSDNDHFNEPQRIAIYGDSLYIADASNHRLQIYSIGASSATYADTIGVSGESGDDNNHLNGPSGVVVDASYVYVADRNNQRVQVFDRTTRAYEATIGTGWGTANDQFENPCDVAVDSAGNIYVSDRNNARVQQFDSSRVYQHTYGFTDTPYVTDTTHLNAPWGIAVAADDSIYLTENQGHRLVKLDASGAQQWTVGQAGVVGSDDAHWSWPRGNLAVDAAGRIYVPDTDNHRIQIFSSNGAYYTTLGNEDCSPGNGLGNKEFCSPGGVAVDSNGRIHVADSDNHRVQIFDRNRVYMATLGVNGVSGSDGNHFNRPQGVAVDASGAIFVADSHNHRVQKCTLSGSSYTCTTSAGVTGECDTDFDHLCFPHAVAVDTAGRVYVAESEHRVQVFDSTGAYLTTIGGAWGANTGLLRNPGGVAVDGAGNVYVADTNNHRIQKYAPGVPGWQQANLNGFGQPTNWAVQRMVTMGGYLYAGTENDTTGGEVWRTSDGTRWSQVNVDGFGTASNTAVVLGEEPFNGRLYAGTANGDSGGQLWRCATCDGTDWAQVVGDGFGDGNNVKVDRLAVFSGALYAAANNEVTGAEVWRSPSGSPGTWTQCNVDGFSDAENVGLWEFAVHNGYLYAAPSQWKAWYEGTQTGLEVWRTSDGVTWTQVNSDGFGDRDNYGATIAASAGYLYVSTTNNRTGLQVWRCATCNGTDWARTVGNGFGNVSNTGGRILGYGRYVYVATGNATGGTEVWRTLNGTEWSQVSGGGLGDSNNVSTISSTIFQGHLFLGTRNRSNGGELWMMAGYPVYLPAVLRNYGQ